MLDCKRNGLVWDPLQVYWGQMQSYQWVMARGDLCDMSRVGLGREMKNFDSYVARIVQLRGGKGSSSSFASSTWLFDFETKPMGTNLFYAKL